MLGAIGLDDTQEAAYRGLVRLGGADEADLARRLALSETTVTAALRRLEEQGLAARPRAGHWVPAPPGVALGALLTRQRQVLDDAERTARLLADTYRTETAEPAVHDLVEVVTGASAVSHRFLQLQMGAVDELCVLVTGTPVAVTPMENPVEDAAVARGVSYRVVLERDALALPGQLSELAVGLGRRQEVRLVEQVPTKLVVADRTLALVPLGGHGSEPAALVIHASGLLELLMGLFERVWRKALPLRLGSGGELIEHEPAGPDETDLRILALLLVGMTDASIAKQLRLGLRTVKRRVKGMMDLAGGTTRIQLGWHAYELGWITGPPPAP
ncbi:MULTISPECIES: winged helix-turn-helix transcriptional regulator [Streptomyces]|uniref:Winged helix-turn-helix transcriptional regulator n=1 Tax=Streptomyces solicathayae TaxID=3081768 RepID=A0ABZ0M236_9ACTN|nr:winged helix-turn-helix transcriptional regulator [Streptomyces sp. HUAS YS2]WOX25841.1 winged helix-turn-helix transcriptional regulator [Streptomyces sp. HUAS YS2]